ncbi:MAG TPA: outer membrane lipoprotein-sorting protein [bacterium]|nr:outer membrane lipoprotein-sorting protein [bacterium]
MTRRLVPALLLALALLRPGLALAQTAEEIVTASDRVRNPGVPFRLTNSMVEYRSGKPASEIVLEIFAKPDPKTGQFRNIARYAEPPRDAGKLIQMVGNVMWFYDPASKASVRLSPQQRLIGQASNGDAVTVNLALDYKGTVLGEETILDADRKNRVCWHLDLKAATDEATYGRAEYWIEKQTYYPIKGKLYSDSGRLLKIVYYRRFEKQLGGVRPMEAIFIDGLDPSLVTTMGFSNYRAQDIPEAWFQRDYLPRIGTE